MSDVTGFFENSVDFVLEEASGEVDGVHVLGKIKGGNFLPSGMSRNKRWYGEGYRKTVLANESVQSKLGSKMLFGTISHNIPINDDSLAEGKFSHVVTKLDEKGGGEALIMDTHAGRLLNTYLRVGSKLSTSTRADGGFSGKHKGIPKIDEQAYKLESIDFVLDPGFIQAQPSLVESLQKDNLEEDFAVIYGTSIEEAIKFNKPEPKHSDNNNDDLEIGEEMSKELLETLAREKIELTKQVEEYLDDNTQLKKDLGAAEAKVTDFNETKKSNVSLEKTVETNKTVVALVEKLGGEEKINEAFEAKTSLDTLVETLGDEEKIGKAFDTLEEAVTGYKAFGSVEEVQTKLDSLEKYEELGSVDSINKVMDVAEDHIEETAKIARKAQAEEIAEGTEISVEKIETLLAKGMDEAEVKEFYGLEERGDNDDDKDKDIPDSKKKFMKKEKSGKEQKEGKGKLPWNEKPLGNRLMESCSR